METTVNIPNDANDNSLANDNNSWDNVTWNNDNDVIINYEDIAYACIDQDMQQDSVEERIEEHMEEHTEEQSTCIYNEICSSKNMCGDCCADDFERERNEQCWENFKLDRKI